jgi:hypothetical protein
MTVIWVIWLFMLLNLFSFTWSKLLPIIRLKYFLDYLQGRPFYACWAVGWVATDVWDDIYHVVPLKFSLDFLLILIRWKDMRLVCQWSIVNPPSPKEATNHFSVVNFSILKEHSPIMFKHSLKKIATIYLFISVDQPQSWRPSFFIYKPNIAGIYTILNLFNAAESYKPFPIYYKPIDKQS